jgi:hypothetical protein
MSACTARRRVRLGGGTSGSNPLCSSAESANFRWPVRQAKLTAERRGDRGVPEEVRRWRTYDRGEVHPREDDGVVGCNPEVPPLALAFRKDDMLAGEPAGREPQEQ